VPIRLSRPIKTFKWGTATGSCGRGVFASPTRDSLTSKARLRWEATMADRSQTNPPSDDEGEGTKFAELADAPVTALGLSSSDADVLEQALGVKTVRDLAENKYVRRAQAIVHLADGNK
jgi:hypothetical protein